MKVAAAMLQIRLLRHMTGGDVAGMPPAMAAPLRDCSEQVCWRRGCGSHGMNGSYISMEVRIYSLGFTVKPQSNMWRSGEKVRS
jgi:hypothetical protein